MSQNDGIMARFDQESHSFVIRLWQEHQESSDAAAVWRGWVEHVQTGHRYYFQDAQKLNEIIFAYLDTKPELTPLLIDLENHSHVH